MSAASKAQPPCTGAGLLFFDSPSIRIPPRQSVVIVSLGPKLRLGPHIPEALLRLAYQVVRYDVEQVGASWQAALTLNSSGAERVAAVRNAANTSPSTASDR